MAEFTLPKNSKIQKGKHFPARRRRKQPCAPSRSTAGTRTTARTRASTPTRSTWRQLRADGSGRADQDQERDRPDADLPPLLPRRHLRFVRDEHRRHQHAGLHQGDRRLRQGRSADLSAAAHAGGQGPGAGPDAFLRAVRLDQAVDPHPERAAAGSRAPAVARKTARSSTACTNASCAPAARPAARATGGTATVTSARRSCCRPTAGSSTRATRTPARAWTTSRIRSSCIAATRS